MREGERGRRKTKKSKRWNKEETNGSSAARRDFLGLSLVSSSHVASTSFRLNACLEALAADAYALFVLQMHPNNASVMTAKEAEHARNHYLFTRTGR